MKAAFLKNLRSRSLVDCMIEGAALVIVFCGLAVAVRMLLIGRSLWYDESALAYSFCQRTLRELTATELDYVQSAPVGWLYLLKIFSLIFGTSVYALRVPSLLFYAGILGMLYWIFSRIFCLQYPMTGVAFAASFPLLLQYSNMFKPYISDGFFCLLAFSLFFLYREGRLQWYALAAGWAILLWFSNPVAFVEGGLLLSPVISDLLRRDRDALRKSLHTVFRVGVIIAGSFVIYYVYWLRQTAVDNQAMLDFWVNWHFPLIPRSTADIQRAVFMLGYLFSQFYRLEYIVIILLGAFAFRQLFEKNVYIIGIYLSAAIAFLASFLHKFPVNKRLWLFLYPLLMIALFEGLHSGVSGQTTKKGRTVTLGVILLGMALLNGGIRYYIKTENVYWDGYEVSLEYDYLKSHRREESVYVFEPIIPEFAYVNHYNSEYIEGTEIPVILGTAPLGENYDCEHDLQLILESESMYLFFSDSWDNEDLTGKLFLENHDAGYLELVYNDYETPLWRYCRSFSDTLARVQYEILDTKTDGEDCVFTVSITNVGETILHPKFEQTVFTNVDAAEQDSTYPDPSGEGEASRQSFEVPQYLEIGESFTVEIRVPSGSSQTFMISNEFGQAVQDILELHADSYTLGTSSEDK